VFIILYDAEVDPVEPARIRGYDEDSTHDGVVRRARNAGAGAPALAGRAPAHAMLSYVYRFAEKPRRDTTR